MYRLQQLSIRGLITLLMVAPLVTSAQFGEIDTFFGKVADFINNVLVPLIFTVALLAFVWGVANAFVIKGASDSDREKGKQLVIYSVIGFVLMVSIWGIVNLIAGGLFGGVSQPPQLPSLPTT